MDWRDIRSALDAAFQAHDVWAGISPSLLPDEVAEDDDYRRYLVDDTFDLNAIAQSVAATLSETTKETNGKV